VFKTTERGYVSDPSKRKLREIIFRERKAEAGGTYDTGDKGKVYELIRDIIKTSQSSPQN